jgi:integrating conjugative element protein (TIGR03755 family)
MKTALSTIVAWILWIGATDAIAVGTPTQDQFWYYEIGGAEPVSVPANPAVNTVVLGGSGRFGLGYSCGRFNPVDSVTNILDSFAADADDMVRNMVTTARNLLAAIPALVLQRAAPDLYDLFQTYLVDAQRRVTLATKTCEQMEREIAKGKNPFEDWINLAKVQTWKDQVAATEDIIEAKDTVDTSVGDGGLPWIYGDRGGLGQEPIQVIRDTAAAGYNVTQNRPPATNPATPAADTKLAETWATPAEAAQWAVDVLGDEIVMTCQDCPRSTEPGTGLLPKFEEERVLVAEGLADLVGGGVPLSFESLDAQSAPGIGISRQLVEAIREMPRNEQGIVVGRMASEIAQARTIDKALLIRRILLTGKKVPEVAAYTVATKTVETAIGELEKEIENLLFETRVRREVVSTTARVVLERDEDQRARSVTQTRVTPKDPNALINGRVAQ